jgi:hypothetical protein
MVELLACLVIIKVMLIVFGLLSNRYYPSKLGLLTSFLLLFPGQNCEIDVSVCNATENKCSNGGQCIDGLGVAFFCYCPPGK